MSGRVITLVSTDTIVTSHGLRSISAYLRRHGNRTKLIFLGTLRRRYPSSLLEQVRQLADGSDLIGFSSYSQSHHKVLQVIETLRSLKIPLLWGGCHVTGNPQECIRHVDMLCVGEGGKQHSMSSRIWPTGRDYGLFPTYG